MRMFFAFQYVKAMALLDAVGITRTNLPFILLIGVAFAAGALFF